LAGRYAKRILFEIYEPQLDLFDEISLENDNDNGQEKDIADVMASLNNSRNKFGDLSARKVF